MNRRQHQAALRERLERYQMVGVLGRLLTRLDLGDVPADDADLNDLLERADARVAALVAENQRTAAIERVEVALAKQEVANRSHHVQFRILDTDDRVLATTMWVYENEAQATEGEIRARMLAFQTEGKDVFLKRYHRCGHVNLTTQVDREWD
jgi:hypothetical protein